MDVVLQVLEGGLFVVKILFWIVLVIGLIAAIRFAFSSPQGGKKGKKKGLVELIEGSSDPTADIEFDYDVDAWRYHPSTEIRRVTARTDVEDPEPEDVVVLKIGKAKKKKKENEPEVEAENTAETESRDQGEPEVAEDAAPDNGDAEEQNVASKETRQAVAVLGFYSSKRGNSAQRFAALVDDVIFNHSKGLISKVVVIIDSPGGYVHEYGLLYAEMERLRALEIEVDVCIDRLGASGGYLGALPGTHIQAAPFSMVGSVGVVTSFLNFARALDRLLIDPKLYTAGDRKRTVTPILPIEPDQEEHFKQKLKVTHDQFVACLRKYRPDAKVDEISSADCWSAQTSVDLELGLVDSIGTSAQRLYELNEKSDLLHFSVSTPKAASLFSSMAASVTSAVLEQGQRLFAESGQPRM